MGAAQVRLAALLRELQNHNHVTEVVTAIPQRVVSNPHRKYPAKLYMSETYGGAQVHRTWTFAGSGFGFRRLLNYLSFASTCLVGMWKCKKPDFIFVESPPLFLGISGLIYSRLRGVPLIFYVADLWPESARAIGVLHDGVLFKMAERLERFIYSHAKYIAAATAGIVSTLEMKKDVPRAKLFLLPNGVDTETAVPIATDERLLDELELRGKKVFLYAGNHGAVAGLETLLEAARVLSNSETAFLFVGDGQAKPDLLRLAKRYELRNVRFISARPVEEMSRYHSIAFASVVHVRKGELFKATRPAKLFTSLACGVPVIYCGEGETAALVKSADVGLVVAPEQPAQLVEAIRFLERHTNVRMRMASNARVLAVKQFGWNLIVGKWLDELGQAESASRAPVRDDRRTALAR